MVENIKNLEIAIFPKTTKLNKWVLEVSKSDERNKGIHIIVNIYFVSSISIVDEGENGNSIYATHYEKLLSDKSISTINDVRKHCCIDDVENESFFTSLDHNKVCLYVSNDYEELVRFIENALDFSNVLP